MMDVLVMLGFVGIHIVLGRKISIPYGIAVGIHPLLVGACAFALDVVQIPFFHSLYESGTRIPFVAGLKRASEERQDSMQRSLLFRLVKNTGRVGIVVISASPLQGGGMWSGVLMTFLLNIGKRESYLLNTLGSLLGCALLVVGANLIIDWMRSIF